MAGKMLVEVGAKIRAEMANMSDKSPISTTDEKRLQDELKLRLLEVGLLTEITPPLPPEKWPKNRKPIPIEGKPISEIIMEERR